MLLLTTKIIHTTRRNTAQVIGQHAFGELAGVAEETDAALLIKDLIFELTTGRQMQSRLKRLTIFSLHLELYPYINSVTSRQDKDSVCSDYIHGCIFMFNKHLPLTLTAHLQPYLRN